MTESEISGDGVVDKVIRSLKTDNTDPFVSNLTLIGTVDHDRVVTEVMGLVTLMVLTVITHVTAIAPGAIVIPMGRALIIGMIRVVRVLIGVPTDPLAVGVVNLSIVSNPAVDRPGVDCRCCCHDQGHSSETR